MANILVVVDDSENLWSLQIALESDGYRVTVAAEARRALESTLFDAPGSFASISMQAS